MTMNGTSLCHVPILCQPELLAHIVVHEIDSKMIALRYDIRHRPIYVEDKPCLNNQFYRTKNFMPLGRHIFWV